MSFDLNLATVCDHRVFRELVLLNEDRRSLRMSKPLAAAANIEIYASDNLLPRSMYTIIYDPNTISVNQPRMVYLRSKWKSPYDFFEVSYVTIKTYCPKCIGLETIDDISFNSRGLLSEARDELLLMQNLEKWTITEIGSNPFHGYVGTSLITLIGQKISDGDFLATKITQEITSALQKFQDLQAQYRQSGRPITDGETLQSIENIEVRIDENDPTIMLADVTVIARSGKSLSYTQSLRIRG